MAQRKKPNQPRRSPRRRKGTAFAIRSPFRRKPVEFKPDVVGSGWSNKFHITHAQRDLLLKWTGFIGLCILMCMIQDVIMSKIHFMGATTDLVISIILLITVMEGVENGSMFILLASMFFYFTGSAPTPWCILVLTITGTFASMFRQKFLHRGLLSITFCAGVALMLYEITTYGIGLFQGLTHWQRIFPFLFKGIYSWAVMLLLYPLLNKIGLIGGNTWKE